MNTEKVIEVLKYVEWVGFDWHCPWCGETEVEGHADYCKLAALLREGVKGEGDGKH